MLQAQRRSGYYFHPDNATVFYWFDHDTIREKMTVTPAQNTVFQSMDMTHMGNPLIKI